MLPWPPNGYTGPTAARELEKAERKFIREMAAPIDLQRLLDRATNYEPLSTLSAREIDAALTAFVQTMQQYVDERLATFVQAEAMFRRDGEDACRIRLDRLRFQTDDYFTRLTTAKTLLVLRLEERERQEHQRAAALNEAMFGHYIDRAEARAAAPVDDWRPHSIAPWINKR